MQTRSWSRRRAIAACSLFLLGGVAGCSSAERDPNELTDGVEDSTVDNCGQPRTVASCGACPTYTLPNVKPVSYWEERFLSTWANEYAKTLPWMQSADSWNYYNGAYAFNSNVQMFEATGNTKYLDRALEYANSMINVAVTSSSLATSQYKDGYKGWLQWTNPSNVLIGQEVSLNETYMWRYVSSMLRLMKQNSAVYNNPNYRAQFDNILAFTETNIYEKWVSRGIGNIYRSNTHMASHWARICLNLYELTGKTKYKTVYDNFTWHFPSGSGWPGCSMKGQLKANPLKPEAYWWDWNWCQKRFPGSDVPHGNAVIGHIVESHDLGYPDWTDDDMRKFVHMLNDVIWRGVDSYGFYVDGSSTGNGWFQDGMSNLGRYDAALQQRLETLPIGVGPSDPTGQEALASMAVNAKILLTCPASCRTCGP